MGSPDFPFRNLDEYVKSCFSQVLYSEADFRPYQPPAVQFLIENPFSALFIDVGMGKTVISLTAILRLITEFDCDYPWLVIAPRRVALETWPTEIQEWQHTAPITFAHIREDEVVEAVNAAGRAERKKIREEVIAQCRADPLPDAPLHNYLVEQLSLEIIPASDESKLRIERARHAAARVAVREHFKNNRAVVHIINREMVEWLVDAWGREFPYRGIIVDESSCFKDYRTKRFKALRRVRPLLKRMHQLTATPAAETYEHLFAQIYLLDEGKRFGKAITKFRERYFTENPYTRKRTLRPGAEEEITEKIADICLVMKAEDHLDLEAPLVVPDKVFLSPEQRALYDEMERSMVVTLPDGSEVEAETAAALSQKLLQMASGVLYETVLDQVGDNFKKRRIVHHLHDHKIDALLNIIEETGGEPLLVAYWHESSLARLKKAFPKAVVMDEDGAAVKPWNAKKIPILLMHPQSSAHGLNMQRGGRRIVFFDLPWSLELYIQLIGRLAGARQLARAAHERVVFIHHLITSGTIDEDVALALVEKRDVQEVFFALLKRIRARLRKSSSLV